MWHSASSLWGNRASRPGSLRTGNRSCGQDARRPHRRDALCHDPAANRGRTHRCSHHHQRALARMLSSRSLLCRFALFSHFRRFADMSSIASSAIPAAALTIAQRLSASLDPDRIWLFGSHARGDATPDSDLDFLVVIPQSADSRYRRAVKARALVTELRVPKDIIVLTREEWTNELRVPSSLASTVLREGVSLYGS